MKKTWFLLRRLNPSISFFFQAEDGIRDSSVTGVQTCALPISIASQFGMLDRPIRSDERQWHGHVTLSPEIGELESDRRLVEVELEAMGKRPAALADRKSVV